ncbi:MAG: hypothetical protein C0518_10785 [Opitutus sp.]|nr:hypothetical protein [Opitutus sp.]
MTQSRPLLPYFVIPALPLLVPLVAMRFTSEVNWTASDFVIAYLLFAGAGFAYRLVTTKAGHLLHRGAAALGVFACLSLIWVNLAVGFIGNEDNPANLLFGGVLAVAALGAVLSRLESRGLARTMFAAGSVQFLVPIVAFLVWRPNFDANVMKIFFLNGVWVLMFAVSGLLFRQAAEQPARA